MSYYIRTKNGVPTVDDFRANDGTPIVINVLTGVAYYIYQNVVRPLQTVPDVTGAFSDGFSEGFS